MTATASPVVSVVVPARDAESHLPDLLHALRAQTLAPDEFEVIIVNDRSRDRTGEMVEKAGFARLVACTSRGGSYGARNFGVGLARGSLIAFTDADCRPDSDWLRSAVATIAETGADLVAGRIDMVVRARPTLAERVDAAHYLDQRSYAARGFGATANLVVRRDVFERIGAFNERLVSNGDREFCLRATAAGCRIVYDHAAIVRHDARRSKRNVARRAFRIGYGRAQTMVLGSRPAANRTRNWLPWRAYLPTWSGRAGADAANRIRPLDHARGPLVEGVAYLLIGVPLIIGYGAGAAAVRLPRWISASFSGAAAELFS